MKQRTFDLACVAFAVLAGIAAIALPLLALAGCSSAPKPLPEPPVVEADAGPFQRACARLAVLHCPEAETNKAGHSCAQVMARAGWLVPVPTGCIAEATDVASVRACGSPSTLRVTCKQ